MSPDDNAHGEPAFAEAPPEDRAKVLRQDVEEIREDLSGLVNELDRRRHAFFDVKGQISRHALPLVLVGLGLVGVVAGGWALAAHRRRRRSAGDSQLMRLLRQRFGLATQTRALATRP